MTARACDPDLLITDEPTTALAVTIQAQVLDLMRRLRAETGGAILLIPHDPGHAHRDRTRRDRAAVAQAAPGDGPRARAPSRP